MLFRINDGDCLSEFGIIRLHQKHAKDRQWLTVKTINEIKKREFVLINAKIVTVTGSGKKYSDVKKLWADWVTGTLYQEDGSCLSSKQIRLMIS